MTKIKGHGEKTELVKPKEDENEKKVFTYDINAGSRAVLRIVQTEVNKLNDNLIKTVKDNVGSMDYKTNVKALMTKWNLSNRYIDRLHQIIKEHLPQELENGQWISHLDFIETWGAIYKHQDYTVPHQHWPCTWSWVYYAQVDEKSSPLVLYNIVENGSDKISNMQLRPRTGQLVMFPSYVIHGVDKTGGIGEDQWRIVLAGNIMLQHEKKDKDKK